MADMPEVNADEAEQVPSKRDYEQKLAAAVAAALAPVIESYKEKINDLQEQLAAQDKRVGNFYKAAAAALINPDKLGEELQKQLAPFVLSKKEAK